MKIRALIGKITFWFVITGVTFSLIVNVVKIIDDYKLDSMIPAEYKKINILDKDNILAGSVVKYELDFCRYVDERVKTDVLVSLLPQSNESLADIPLGVSYANPASRCATVKTERLLPTETLPGTYKLRICGYYYVVVGKAPKPICITSEEFNVNKASASAIQLDSIQKQIDQLKTSMIEPMKITSIVPTNNYTPPASSNPIIVPNQNNKPTWNYKVYSDKGKQLGAYKEAKNAINKYNMTNGLSKILDKTGKDVTHALLGDKNANH